MNVRGNGFEFPYLSIVPPIPHHFGAVGVILSCTRNGERRHFPQIIACRKSREAIVESIRRSITRQQLNSRVPRDGSDIGREGGWRGERANDLVHRVNERLDFFFFTNPILPPTVRSERLLSFVSVYENLLFSLSCDFYSWRPFLYLVI